MFERAIMLRPGAGSVDAQRRCGMPGSFLAYALMKPDLRTSRSERSSCRRRVLLAALLVGFGGCSSFSPPPRVVFETEDWTFHKAKGTKLISENYVLHTTCTNRPLLAALPAFMESSRAAYAALIPCDKPDVPRADSYLFQTRAQWERFTREFAGPRAATYLRIRSGGYSERGITVSHYSSRRATLSILAHEGLHQYLELTRGRNIPPWVNEGLACYFESFDLDPEGRADFNPVLNTLRLPALRNAVSRKQLLPLKEILATHAGLEVHKQTTQVSHYYAQEWSLVLYLLTNSMESPYDDKFRVLLQELGTETMDRKARAYMAADTEGSMSYGEAVFRAYICDDLEKFQSDYERFLEDMLKMAA